MSARGPIRIALPQAPSDVEEGDVSNLEYVDEIDQQVRCVRRIADVKLLLDLGCKVLIGEDGYAVMDGGKVMTLAALNESAAEQILLGALARCPKDKVAQVDWITADQQWAFRVATNAGMSLRSHGAVMARGWDEMPGSYLPNGMFG